MSPVLIVGYDQRIDMCLHFYSYNSILVLVENPLHSLAFDLALWNFLHSYSTYNPQSNTRLLLEV